jgi:hypothetical protein
MDGHGHSKGQVVVTVYVRGKPEDAVMGERSLGVLQIKYSLN